MPSLFSKRVLALALGVPLFLASGYYIYHQFQWAEILRILRGAELVPLFVGCSATIVIFWFFRSFRWMLLLKMQGYRAIPFSWLYYSTSSSLALSVVTPFQSGELIKVELFRRRYPALSRSDGYFSFAIERLLDVLVVILITGVGLTLGSFDTESLLSVSVAGVVCFLFFVLLFSITLRLKHRHPIVGAIANQVDLLASDRWLLMAAVLMTICAWLSIAAGWWFAFISIDIYLPIIDVIALTGGMTLINVASFIPGGIGISEAGVSLWLEQLDTPTNQATAAAVLTRLYGFLAAVLGLLCFGIAKLFGR